MLENEKYLEMIKLCSVYEMAYEQKYSDYKEEGIYPSEWNNLAPNEEKIKMLEEAFEKDTLIENTDAYKKYISRGNIIR